MIRLCLALVLCCGSAHAHEGVKDPEVMARMHSMKEMGAAAKVLGEMAKGTRPFDAAQATRALAAITVEAERTPALFAAPADDPKSEAKRAIWSNMSDFNGKSKALLNVARAARVSAPSDLGPALGQIGAACKACHQSYRE